MDEKERKQKYRTELLTAGMVLGLAMTGVLVLQYVLRGVRIGWVGMLLSLAGLAVTAAVLVGYGRRAAALCPPDERRPEGFTYGRAFGFSLLVCLLGGVIYGAGYFVMAEAVDPAYFGQIIDQVVRLYIESGLMTQAQAELTAAAMHNLLMVILGYVLAMALQGGFVALFTAAIVRRRA